MSKLTPAEAYKLQVESDRRQAYIDRQREEIQGDIARVQALYKYGSKRRAAAPAAPPVKEPTRFTVTRLPGGLETSLAAEKAAATRRARRAERKAKG